MQQGVFLFMQLLLCVAVVQHVQYIFMMLFFYIDILICTQENTREYEQTPYPYTVCEFTTI